MKLPQGYQTIMPYLIVNDAALFQKFMQKVFNATEKVKHNTDDNKVMHAEVVVGGSTIMFADSSDAWPVITAGLYINVEDADKTYQEALENGASSIMEPSNQSYGRTCGVKDPVGNTWWITTPIE